MQAPDCLCVPFPLVSAQHRAGHLQSVWHLAANPSPSHPNPVGIRRPTCWHPIATLLPSLAHQVGIAWPMCGCLHRPPIGHPTATHWLSFANPLAIQQQPIGHPLPTTLLSIAHPLAIHRPPSCYPLPTHWPSIAHQVGILCQPSCYPSPNVLASNINRVAVHNQLIPTDWILSATSKVN